MNGNMILRYLVNTAVLQLGGRVFSLAMLFVGIEIDTVKNLVKQKIIGGKKTPP